MRQPVVQHESHIPAVFIILPVPRLPERIPFLIYCHTMTFYFRTFRRALSVAMLVISATTIVLAFLALPNLVHNAVPWLLVTIQTLSFMRTLWSITRKSLLNTSQSVASEAIGLFSLFPFHLILALIVATTEFKDKTSPAVYFLLQTFVIGSSAIHILYTTCLIVIAMLTVSAFDGDVWIRDIDSSPSPFPMPIVIAFLCPRKLTWWCSRQRGYDAPTSSRQAAHDICSPPCDCPVKPPESLQPEPKLSGEMERLNKAKSLPHTLIRIPDAAEQRASISISFETLGRFN